MTEDDFAIAFQSGGSRRTTRLLCRLGLKFEDAEDIAQTAFLKAWRKIDTLRDDNALMAWVFRIARNEAKDRFRRSWASVEFDDAPERVNGLSQAQPELPRLKVIPILVHLKPRRRLIMVAYYLHGVPTEKIALVLKMSRPAVHKELSRGRLEMRAELKHEAA